MVKIKLTDFGGYVIGDGNLPAGFNPDQWMKDNLKRLLRKRVGNEIDITDEIEGMIQQMEVSVDKEFDEATTYEYANEQVTADELTGMLDNVQQQIEAAALPEPQEF